MASLLQAQDRHEPDPLVSRDGALPWADRVVALSLDKREKPGFLLTRCRSPVWPEPNLRGKVLHRDRKTWFLSDFATAVHGLTSLLDSEQFRVYNNVIFELAPQPEVG